MICKNIQLLADIRPYLVLTILCLSLYLPGLATVPPLDRDEARFAQATRQMLETGDFIRIRFQNTSRHKKPVGIYWLQVIAIKAFSNAAVSAIWPYRLPSVAGALVAVLLTFYFGQVLFERRIALLAAILLSGTLMVVIEAHQAKTDAVILACVVAAQGALARVYLKRRYACKEVSVDGLSSSCQLFSTSLLAPGLETALIFWLAQGIGCLVKGPIVPMVSGLTIIGLWGWEKTKPEWLKGLQPLIGIPLMIALVSPWFIAIHFITNGSFIIDAVHTDLLPKLIGAHETHGAPPGYFVLLVILTFWPTSLFLWPAIMHAWAQRTVPAVRFCLAWVGPTWLLFEMVPTKLPHYVLPVYPALALLVAVVLVAAEKDYRASILLASNSVRLWYGIWLVLSAVLAGAFLTVPAFLSSNGFLWSALTAAASTVITVWLIIQLNWQRLFLLAAYVANVGSEVSIIILFSVLIPDLDLLWLSQRIHTTLTTTGIDHLSVIAAGYHEPSLVFELGTHTVLSDGSSAAAYVVTEANVVAVVSQEENRIFQQTLAEHGLKLKPLSVIDGLNYSRGRHETLSLYHIKRHPTDGRIPCEPSRSKEELCCNLQSYTLRG